MQKKQKRKVNKNIKTLIANKKQQYSLAVVHVLQEFHVSSAQFANVRARLHLEDLLVPGLPSPCLQSLPGQLGGGEVEEDVAEALKVVAAGLLEPAVVVEGRVPVKR